MHTHQSVYTYLYKYSPMHSRSWAIFTYQYLHPTPNVTIRRFGFIAQEVPASDLGYATLFWCSEKPQSLMIWPKSYKDTLFHSRLVISHPKCCSEYEHLIPHIPISGKVCTSNDWGLSGWNHWRAFFVGHARPKSMISGYGLKHSWIISLLWRHFMNFCGPVTASIPYILVLFCNHQQWQKIELLPTHSIGGQAVIKHSAIENPQ